MKSEAKAAVLAWFVSHKRDLPWRRTTDPYAIWVSEIMLQQTQVETVIPFYERWLARFPTVESLAAADEQEALSLWQGLGYYRRCRMLLQGARYVAERGWPKGASEWQNVPGVGRYTANAIASISGGEPAPVADGNVERVFARFTECHASKPALTKLAWDWAHLVLDAEDPGSWNQALMELGATVCRPVSPECDRCPLRESCRAFKNGLAHELPVRAPKPPTVKLHQTAWIPVCNGRFGVRQIPDGEWWHGMWEFPTAGNGRTAAARRERKREPSIQGCVEGLKRCIEGPKGCAEGPADLVKWTGPTRLSLLGSIHHSVTHHVIRVEAFLACCETESDCLRWLTPEKLEEIPMPSPQRRLARMAIANSADTSPARAS